MSGWCLVRDHEHCRYPDCICGCHETGKENDGGPAKPGARRPRPV